MSNESLRKVLIGLITNKEFNKEYVKLFPENQFKGILGVSLIEKWCRNYYNKYEQPLGSNIRIALDKSIQSKLINVDELKYVEMLLQSLSNEEDTTAEADPVDYLLDLAVQEVNKLRLSKLQEGLASDIERGDVESALKAWEHFKKVEAKEEEPKYSLLGDAEEIAKLVTSKEDEPFLVAHADNMYEQELFSQIRKKDYTVLRAKVKSFKSYGLAYISLVSALQKHNTLLITLGDLSAAASLRRLCSLILHKPLEAGAHKKIKVPHIDCLGNVYGTCMNINRTCDKCYKDEDGNFVEGYKPCTACKGERAFPACISTFMEDTGDGITEKDVQDICTALKKHIGEDGVYDLYSYNAKEMSVSDIREIVKGYFEKGKPIEVLCIDYWGLLKHEAGTERLAVFDRVNAQAVALKNLCNEFSMACVIADQASVRGVDNNTTSDSMITAGSYTEGVSKDNYCSSVVCSSVQNDDRKNNTIKLHTLLSRFGAGSTLGNGYIWCTCPVGVGQFANESFHVDEDILKSIEDYKKEHGLDGATGRKKK